ncbi:MULTISPECIES: glycyl-radical enzyme activating protein [Mediterraneibacter]|jgi:pyruvate formate lyase activating enzyme|uniref:glycyl-radical enzyme activating protein n=1 Tax=Mediterraneibacter TaxID=2316020 RepID=UPI000E4C86C4|nr:glycyl-radical enzyme activating protein [Mediterraneibacter massiliensis]RGT75096.1 glycyl-radical enzyme activating protein [Ruminococcus sp. AF18-22]
MSVNLSDEQIKAPVFNIQSFCIHDGPGIRTTIFLKGCPLRCLWCQNPESYTPSPQLMVYSNFCKGCMRCTEVCPVHAIKPSGNTVCTDRSLCTNCGNCIAVCQNQAREIVGQELSVSEVMQKILSEKIFLQESNGGITISGGEALSHPLFAARLYQLAHQESLHTALETSCYASRETIDQVFAELDLALIDIKHMDPALHKKYTGVPNEAILSNIQYISNQLGTPIIIRYPVIPGYNDSDKNITETARFVRKVLGPGAEIDLLPYHDMGNAKRSSLDKEVTLFLSSPSQARMEEIADMIRFFELHVKIGG